MCVCVCVRERERELELENFILQGLWFSSVKNLTTRPCSASDEQIPNYRLIYIHIVMNECVKRYTREFPHKT